MESTRLGRRVLIKAPSRSAVASAVRAVLFQLCYVLKASNQLASSRWSYYLDQVGAAMAGEVCLEASLRLTFSPHMLLQKKKTACCPPQLPCFILTGRAMQAI